MTRSITLSCLFLFFSMTFLYNILVVEKSPSVAELNEKQSLRYAQYENRISQKGESVFLQNVKHEVIFSPERIRFQPKNQGPEFSWSLVTNVATDFVSPTRLTDQEGQDHIVYQRGEMVERYRIGQDFIEQQFVLEKMPTLENNKLYIKGKIECEGIFRQEEAHWVWENEKGKVRLGDVTVYDADQNILAASMQVTEEGTMIIVDGMALANATYPVTIDPVLDAADVNYSTSPSGRNAIDPEVAYNPDDNEYVVVFPADFATAGTKDIYAQRVSATTGAKVGSPLKISSMPSGQGALDPDIVYNETSDEFFVVWNTGPSTQKVLGRRVAKNLSGVLGSEITIGNTTTVSLFLLGNRIAWNSTDNEYFVVFSSVTQASVFTCRDIKAQRISSAGAAVGGLISVETAVCSGSTTRREFYEPDVAYNNDKNEYLVVYRGGESSEFDFEVFYERFSNTGTNIQGKTVMTATTTPNNLTSFPRVAYNRQGSSTGKYLVTYQTQYGAASNVEVYAQLIDGNGVTTVGSHFAISNPADSKGGADGELTFNPHNNEFLVMWMNYNGGFPDQVWVQRLNTAATKIGSAESISSSLLFNQVEGGMAIRNNSNESLIVYEAGFPNSDVFGRRYTTVTGPPPLVAVCQNLTVSLNASGNASIAASAINNGSNGGVAPLSLVASQTSFSCSNIGINTVTLTVTDANNVTANCAATVNITDVTPPTAICQNATIQIGAGGTATVTAANIDGGSNDACSGSGSALARVASPSSFNCSQVGIQTVTLTVYDAPGSSASCSANVTVQDNIPPNATCNSATVSLAPNDTFLMYTFVLENLVNASDNCGLSATHGLGEIDAYITCEDVGTRLINFTINDVNGNSTPCPVMFTVLENTPPDAACKNTLVNLDANGDASIAGSDVDGGSSDNCGIASLSVSPSAFSCNDLGSNGVVLTVTDGSGNSASCSASVTVLDNTPPTAGCQNLTLQLDANGNTGTSPNSIESGSSDNCGTVITQNLTPNSFDCNDIGANTVTLTVRDNHGNTASCTATVTVEDNIVPSLSLIGVNPIVICEGDVLLDPGAVISDNCGGGTIPGNTSGVNTNQEGTYNITYNYSDPGGNAAPQITRTVIVEHTPGQLAPQNCGSCSQIRFDFCEGDPTPDLEALLTANANYESGITFNWYADNSGSQGSPIGTPSVNTGSNNTRFYWVSQQDGNCEGPARRMRVRVRKTSIVVFDLPALGCNPGQINLAAYVSDSRGIATGFSFYDSDPDLGSPTALGTATATNGVVNAGQYVIVSVPPNPITYYATAGNNTGCQVTASDLVVSTSVAALNPISNVVVNAGDLVNVSFSGTNTTQIIWFDLAVLGNPYIGIMGSLGIGNLMFTAQNTTLGPLTATIRVIPYNGNCAGTFQDFTITVNPSAAPRQARNSLQLAGHQLAYDLIQLDWDIRYEFALTHFEVEKLQADGSWNKVAEVAWQEDQHGYSYVDADAMSEGNSYRLKLVHADGRAVWSREVFVNINLHGAERFILYPNPTSGRFNMRAEGSLEGDWQYQLYDQLGRALRSGPLRGRETALDISELPIGYYYLRISNPEGLGYIGKIAKR